MMNKLRKLSFFSFKWSVLRKTVFFYAVLVLVVVTSVSFITMDSFTNYLKKDAKKSAEAMTRKTYNSADVLLSSTYHYFSRVFANNAEIFSAMYGDEFSPVQTKNFSDMLIDLKSSNPLIESVYIFNLNHDAVFSSETTFSSVNNFFDPGMADMLKQKDFLKQGLFIPRTANITYKSDPYEVDVITMAFTQIRNVELADGAFVVNLNQNNLQKIITDAGGDPTRQSVILNKSGKVLSRSEGGVFDQDMLQEEEFVQEILSSESDMGQINRKLNGKSYWVFYQKSSPLGLTFISMAEEQSMLGLVKKVQMFILGITLVFAAIAVIMALFSIRNFYTPVRQIVKRIGVSATRQDRKLPHNEYDLIETWLAYQEKKVQELESSISGYLDAGKKEALRSIIHGGFTAGQAGMEKLSKLGISLMAEDFTVCIVRIDQYRSLIGQYQQRDISLFKFAMMNIAGETMAPYCTAELLDEEEDSFVMILNLEQGPLTPELLEGALLQVQANIGTYLNMSVTVSAGHTAAGIGQIKYSWKQAFLASKYRIVKGIGSIIIYEDDMTRQSTVHEYPYALEKQMMDSMKLGSKAKHAAVAEEFFQEISGYHYEEIILFLSQMLMMTERVANAMVDHDEMLHTELLTLSDSLRQWDTLELILEQYRQICGRIMDFRDNDSSKRVMKVIDKVKEFIGTEYSNPELTVDDMAKHVGMSKNHLRKIFSDQCGDTLSQYLSVQRFEKAKELLLHTDYPAAKISEMVGIANSNYFYISFKKYAGKSPVHYRMENKLN
jgi:two-component system, response regulator YesN